mmetsp:Transcript_15050/g.48407  ORF Transcript_15050/g.48407 Transcript_15050/m.48407 type:complete len:147 (-) Transcript_15050:201-641(-)
MDRESLDSSESGAGASSSDGLPRAAVAKLVKERLPPHLRAKPDVAALLSEMAGEFLQMLTSEANEAASAEKKKTLSEAHLLGALRKLGYPQLATECEAVGEAEQGAQAARPLTALWHVPSLRGMHLHSERRAAPARLGAWTCGGQT